MPLVNPDFERGSTGWAPAKAEAFMIVTDPGLAHSGKACLKFDAAAQTKYTPSVSQPLKEAGSGVYRLRFWIKTSELGQGDKNSGGLRLSLEYHMQDGERHWPSTEIFKGTADCRQQELRAYLPPDLEPGSVVLRIGRYGVPNHGEAWVGDLNLEKAVPPPIEAFLVYPNYRGFLPDDGPQKVRIWVKASDNGSLSGGRIEVINLDTKAPVITQKIPTGQEQIVILDASQWPLGNYSLQARVADYAYPAYLVRKIAPNQRERLATWFDSDNNLMRQGKRAFILGFYNAQGFEPMERLEQLAQASPNMAIDYISWALPTSTQRAYLEQMNKHGLWFLSTVNMVLPGHSINVFQHPIGQELCPQVEKAQANLANLDQFLGHLAGAMRQMPGHAGWYVMDERDFGDAPKHFHQAQVLRENDPDHPTYAVSNKPKELAFWRDTVDVIGLDPYPLMNMKAGRPLSDVASWTKAAVDATHGSRPIWMVIQFFHIFAYRPARQFSERENGQVLSVTFTFKDGQIRQREFKPDTAEWLEVTPKSL